MPTHRPSLGSVRRDRRAQSESLAILLLVAVTVLGGGTILMFGAGAIDDTTTSVDVNRAEHAMTQLDSKASLVAHGSSDTVRVGLAGDGRGTMELDENTGRMTVRVINGTHGNETVLDEPLGTVTYDRGGTTLAYQGGGVWRTDGNGSSMVSPPEFHYDGGTLTLPLVRVTGDTVSSDGVRIVQRSPTDGRYPNETRHNPLTQGRVQVTVESDYYRAWGSYFSGRTQGNVTYDHSNETATIELITPFKAEFDNVLATTDGGITVAGGDPPTPSETGANYAPVDPRVEERIDNCVSGGCKSWTTDVNDEGTYYTESDVKNDDITVDTTGGNVSLVVNGTFEPKSVDVTGSNNLTVFVNDDASFGDVNDGGSPDTVRVLVHSSGDVDVGGNAVFVGLLYAPGSHADLNGQGTIRGGVIAESINVNGGPANDFHHDPSVQDVELGVGSGEPPVLYLHVSVTTVEVEDG